MDTKDVVVTVLHSLYTKLTTFENARVTFSIIVLSVPYLELFLFIKLLTGLVCIKLCNRLYTDFCDKLIAKTFECQGRGVLISSCDSGLGHDVAKDLDSLGFTIFAGCLRPHGYGARLLKAYCSKRTHVLPLDVTSDESVEAASTYVVKHSPKFGLWGVVNTADLDLTGEVELMPIGQCQELQEVNVYGVIRPTKAFLPLIRKTSGRVLTISNMFRHYSYPSLYAYTSSKRGITTAMDSLRLEMKKFDVTVSLIETVTNDRATSITSGEKQTSKNAAVKNAQDEVTDEQMSSYGRGHVATRGPPGTGTFKPTGHSTFVMQAVQRALTSSRPKPTYEVYGSRWMLFGKSMIITRLERVLPTWISDLIKINLSGCNKVVR